MLGLGEFSTTNDTNEGGDVLGDLNLARREKFSVFSGQWSVVSGEDWRAFFCQCGVELRWGVLRVSFLATVERGKPQGVSGVGCRVSGVGCRVSGILACCFVGGKGLVGRF